MDNSASIIAQCPGESRLTQLGPDGEHVYSSGKPRLGCLVSVRRIAFLTAVV